MAIQLDFILPYPPDAVWAVVGDPARTDWVPGVESCEFAGGVRRFRLAEAGQLAERILLRDPGQRRLEYAVIESSPSLESHFAAIQIDSHASGALLRWETRVEPQAVEPFIRRNMEAAIAELKRILQLG